MVIDKEWALKRKRICRVEREEGMKGRELRGGRKSINVAIGSSQPLTGC